MRRGGHRTIRSMPSFGSRRSRRRKRSSASASTIRTATPSTRTARTRRNFRACSCARRAPLSATTTPLVRPRESAQLDYEGELVLVIGKAGRHITESDGARPRRRRHAVQRGHHPRLGAARQVQCDAGQEFRLDRQPRSVAGALCRRIADRGHPADDARQRRDAAGRPHRAADLRLPLSHQLYLDLHHAGARRRHRDGNADRRRRAVRSAALPQARRRHRSRGRRIGVLRNGVVDEA